MDVIRKRIRIRSAVLADAHSPAELVQEAGLSEKINELPISKLVPRIENAIEMCAKDKSYNIHVVVDNEEGILAYAVIQWHITLFLPGNEGYISELTVRADCRGEGIGSMLLEKPVEEATRRWM